MTKLGIENYKKRKIKSAAFVVAELWGFKIGVDSFVPFTWKVTIEPAFLHFCYRIQFFDSVTGVPWILMGVFVKSCESDENRLVCIEGEYFQQQLKQSKNTSLLSLPSILNVTTMVKDTRTWNIVIAWHRSLLTCRIQHQSSPIRQEQTSIWLLVLGAE